MATETLAKDKHGANASKTTLRSTAPSASTDARSSSKHVKEGRRHDEEICSLMFNGVREKSVDVIADSD